MATHRDILVDQPGVRSALDQLKMEVAQEIAADPDLHDPGLETYFRTGYGGEMKAKTAGAIGGHMVRHMIEIAEETLAQEAQARFGAAEGVEPSPPAVRPRPDGDARREAPLFAPEFLLSEPRPYRQPDSLVH